MFHNHFVRRAAASGASCAVALVLCATSAGAKESAAAKENKRAVCTGALSAYKHAVEESKAGHLREARASLATCMEATTCGGLVPKCKAVYEKLGNEMPSVVPIVTDENGAPRVDVEVKVDGVLLTSQIDGRGLPVDAGVHEFTFSTEKGVFATEKVLVVEGQRNRPLEVSMGGPPKPAAVAVGPVATPVAVAEPKATEPSEKTSEKTADEDARASASHGDRASGGAWAMPRSVFPYILGGVGLAGIAAGGLMTFWGNKDNTDLETSCSPNCRPSSVDHVKTMYVAADISFGVGAAALAVTTILFATSRSTEAADRPAPREALKLDVAPTRSGAFATVSGAF